MPQQRFVIVAFAALALVAAAPAQKAATKSVTVSDNAFSRSSVSIVKNDTVTWNWADTDNRHNVTVQSGPSNFHSKTRRGNYSFSKKFKSTGTWNLYCTLHADEMKMKVKVRTKR